MDVTVYFHGGYVVEGNFSVGEDVELHMENQIDDMATAQQVAMRALERTGTISAPPQSGKLQAARELLGDMAEVLEADAVSRAGQDPLSQQNDVVQRRRNHGRVYVSNLLGIRARVHKSRIAWHCYATNEVHKAGSEFIALHLYGGSRARLCVECWLAGKGPRE